MSFARRTNLRSKRLEMPVRRPKLPAEGDFGGVFLARSPAWTDSICCAVRAPTRNSRLDTASTSSRATSSSGWPSAARPSTEPTARSRRPRNPSSGRCAATYSRIGRRKRPVSRRAMREKGTRPSPPHRRPKLHGRRRRFSFGRGDRSQDSSAAAPDYRDVHRRPPFGFARGLAVSRCRPVFDPRGARL